MDRGKALLLLEERDLPLENVRAIYEAFADDMEVVGKVAMNLSLRTSVYERQKGAHPVMRELLERLANAEDMGARWAVAKNPHTPPSVLKKLASDEINLVRALAATNPNTPVECLERLYDDEKIVRDGLSGNPNTPPHILEKLAGDSDKLVRLRVAENPAAPKEVLERLARDANKDVAKAAQIKLGERNDA